MSGQPITSSNGGGGICIMKFAKALADIRPVAKSQTADAGTYEYSYANLTDTMRAVNDALAAHDLTFSQNVAMRSTDAGDWVTVATTVYWVHPDADKIASEGNPVTGYEPVTGWMTWEPLHVKPGADPQKMGSAITYAKRYALTALFGIPTVDDDGVQARQSIEEDTAELAAMQEREQRARKVKTMLPKLDDEQKAILKSVVFDETGRNIYPAKLAEDEEVLATAEEALAGMGLT